MNLHPGTLCMPVIARAKDAVYLRLPPELQRDCGGCNCPQCTKNPELAKWDTLCVPITPPGNHSDFSHVVHMPDGSVQAFIDYVRKTGRGKPPEVPDVFRSRWAPNTGTPNPPQRRLEP